MPLFWLLPCEFSAGTRRMIASAFLDFCGGYSNRVVLFLARREDRRQAAALGSSRAPSLRGGARQQPGLSPGLLWRVSRLSARGLPRVKEEAATLVNSARRPNSGAKLPAAADRCARPDTFIIRRAAIRCCGLCIWCTWCIWCIRLRQLRRIGSRAAL